jgi:hypothetical protein
MVYHTNDACPSPAYIHDLPVYVDLVPDPARIQGDQMSSGKNKGKGKGTTFPCKYVGCDRKNRKAFRGPHTANRHMMLVHEPTDLDYAQLAYPVEDALAQEPPKPASAKRGRPRKKAALPAPKPKRTTKSKPAHRDSTSDEKENSSWDEADDDDDAHMYARENTEDDEEQESTDDESGRDNNTRDPDELVAIDDGDNYVVEKLLGHRLLASGTTKYHVQWVGYKKTTWECEDHINSHLRADYHRQALVDAAKLVEAAGQRRGRARRGAPPAIEHDQPLLVRTEIRTAEIMAAGATWFNAYEQAQKELGYA